MANRRQRDRFDKKMELLKSQYFCIFMIIWWFLDFWFFCGKLTKPCCRARTAQMVSEQARQVLSIKTKHFNKTAACSHHCPLWQDRRHWELVHQGIPSDLWSRLEQSHHLPGLCSPMTTGNLSSVMGVPIFNSTENILSSLFMIKFWDYSKKVIFDEIYSFDREIYLSGAICWKCGAI